MMTESNSKRFSVMHFIQDVRSETRKVTWPTRKETLVT
ncbi:MAG: preprotein translocase subunit SecE, partial [Alphaproteobacteria bacterium]|nr:preprotein translocase subunit SecE [Alphaproteobacteria bacterium]